MFHGYRRDIQCWQCFVILRLIIMITVAGSTSSWQPNPLEVTFADTNVYIYSPPKHSDYGSFNAVVGGFLMYLLGEIIREL